MYQEFNDGVWGHSSVIGFNEYVIFAIDQGKEDSFQAWRDFVKLPCKGLLGCYKGQYENSYIVNRKVFDDSVQLKHYTFYQESFLYLGACNARDQRPATLVFNHTDEHIDLGFLKAKAKDEALKRDGWTFDPLTSTYFVCE